MGCAESACAEMFARGQQALLRGALQESYPYMQKLLGHKVPACNRKQ